MASQSSVFDAFMPSSVLLVVIAWVLVLASAVAVVMVTHVNRQQLHQLQLLRREAADLQVVWGQYLLEGGARRLVELSSGRASVGDVPPLAADIVMVAP